MSIWVRLNCYHFYLWCGCNDWLINSLQVIIWWPSGLSRRSCRKIVTLWVSSWSVWRRSSQRWRCSACASASFSFLIWLSATLSALCWNTTERSIWDASSHSNWEFASSKDSFNTKSESHCSNNRSPALYSSSKVAVTRGTRKRRRKSQLEQVKDQRSVKKIKETKKESKKGKEKPPRPDQLVRPLQWYWHWT